MKSNPVLAPSVTIREMTESDIPAVNELAAKIWHKHYPDIISREQIDYMLNLMYSPTALATQLKQGHRFWLLFNEATLAGYLSAEAKGESKWFIQKLYIDQSISRQGLGSTLIQHLIQAARPKELALVVNRKNYKAINFYFRHGFFIDSLVTTDIGNGFVMDDFKMKRIV